MINLVRAEIRKLRTTHIWWIMLTATLLFGALATAANIATGNARFGSSRGPEFDSTGNPIPGTENAPIGRSAILEIAGGIYTSGQLLGLLFVLLLGVLIITNEYRHKTATVTFLAEPRRDRVIVAKLITSLLWGATSWLLLTLMAVPAGAIFLASQDVGAQLGETVIIQTILLNGMAFGIWAIFGLGLGALLKNQIGAVVAAIVLYLGQFAIWGVLAAIAAGLKTEWIADIGWWLPAGASTAMITPVQAPGQPVWWAGALTLLAYGLVAGGIGTAITVRRDIS